MNAGTRRSIVLALVLAAVAALVGAESLLIQILPKDATTDTAAIGGQRHVQTSGLNPITVEHPWARATPGGAMTGAAYMTLINSGDTADQLLGATTPVAEKVQFHKETEENGVARMREMHAVDLEPGTKIIFKPGEMHMMIVGLKQPLTEGQAFQLTLQFEKADDIEVTVPIEKVGAMQQEDIGSMMPVPDDAAKK
jgi:periplasmic copper chaperone A